MSKRKVTMGVADCEGCKALCCSDLEEPIIRPTTNQDVGNLKWQLHFESIRVFIRNNRWRQLTMGKCMYLGSDNLCSIYENRPQTCRDHNPPECEQFGQIYDIMFTTPDDLDEHITQEKMKRKEQRNKKIKPSK